MTTPNHSWAGVVRGRGNHRNQNRNVNSSAQNQQHNDGSLGRTGGRSTQIPSSNFTLPNSHTDRTMQQQIPMTSSPSSLTGQMNNLNIGKKSPLVKKVSTIVTTNYFEIDTKTISHFYRYELLVSQVLKPENNGKSHAGAFNRYSKGPNPRTGATKGSEVAKRIPPKIRERVIFLLLHRFQKDGTLRGIAIASDFKDSLITVQELPSKICQIPYEIIYFEETEDIGQVIDLQSPEAAKRKQYTVQIRLMRTYPLIASLTQLKDLQRTWSQGLDESQSLIGIRNDIIRMFNMIFGHSAKMQTFRVNSTPMPAIMNIGSSKYYESRPPNTSRSGPWELRDLPLYALAGIFFSSHLTLGGRMLLNMNTTTSAFFEPSRLSDLLNKLAKWPWSRISTLMHGLRVQTTYMNTSSLARGAGPKPEKVFTVYSLASTNHHSTASETKFLPEGKQEKISVYDYWTQEHPSIELAAGDHVISLGSKPIFIPAKYLQILPGQFYKQKTDMVEKACRKPSENRKMILEDGMRILGIDNPGPRSSTATAYAGLNNFSVEVRQNLLNVQAKWIATPKVAYSDKSEHPQTSRLRDGRWNLANMKFVRASSEQKWSIIELIRGEKGYKNTGIPFRKLKDWVDQVESELENYGIASNSCFVPHNNAVKHKLHLRSQAVHPSPLEESTDMRELEIKMRTLFQDHGANLFFIILPNKEKALYALVKRVGDQKTGFPTICHVSPLKFQPQFIGNLAMKFNLKSSVKSANQTIQIQSRPELLTDGTMLMGMDVTHPSFEAHIGSPSIAAVVGSIDSDFSQYPASLEINARPQDDGGKSMEEIMPLRKMVTERLRAYQTANHKLPRTLIIFRDGLSHEQFQMCLTQELTRIKAAINDVYGSAISPKILLICTVKRHQTRFFPPESAKGKKEDIWDRNDNLKPGIFIDSDITLSRDQDFYLVSQHTIKGTARPTHYVVLHNETSAGLEDIAVMTHNLCYLFGRATTSVGLCTPAYYADLAADRARCFFRAAYSPQEKGEYRGNISVELGEKIRDRMFYI